MHLRSCRKFALELLNITTTSATSTSGSRRSALLLMKPHGILPQFGSTLLVAAPISIDGDGEADVGEHLAVPCGARALAGVEVSAACGRTVPPDEQHTASTHIIRDRPKACSSRHCSEATFVVSGPCGSACHRTQHGQMLVYCCLSMIARPMGTTVELGAATTGYHTFWVRVTVRVRVEMRVGSHLRQRCSPWSCAAWAPSSASAS